MIQNRTKPCRIDKGYSFWSHKCLLILLLIGFCFCSTFYDDNVPLQINVQFADKCADPIQCFTSMIKCGTGQEKLTIELKISLANLHRYHDHFPLFSKTSELVFELQYDKTVLHYDVVEKSKIYSKAGWPGTEDITKKLFYTTDNPSSKQFKTINEFYGNVTGVQGDAFARLIVQFLNCGQLFLFGFIRHNDILYRIRPLATNLKKSNAEMATTANIHELFYVTSGIESNIFSAKSKEIDHSKRRKRSVADHKLCLVKVIADHSFYRRMNSNYHQVVIYIKTGIMLLNEIYSNSEWDDPNGKNFKVVLPNIEIDLGIASQLGNYTEEQVMQTLLNIEKREHYCVIHMFTDKMMIRPNLILAHGLSFAAILQGYGAFEDNNTGITSTHDCGPDPWRVQCHLTFPHELAHSFGAEHDLESDRTENSFLMTQVNMMSVPIGPNNLALSPKSVQEISKYFHTRQEFVVAKNKKESCGNGIVELGEECDEGLSSLCCEKNCTLKRHLAAQCSPYNSLCCKESCQFKLPNETICVPWNYCTNDRLYCTHKQSYCHLSDSENSLDDILKIDCKKVQKKIREQEERLKFTTKRTPTSTISSFDDNPTVSIDSKRYFALIIVFIILAGLVVFLFFSFILWLSHYSFRKTRTHIYKLRKVQPLRDPNENQAQLIDHGVLEVDGQELSKDQMLTNLVTATKQALFKFEKRFFDIAKVPAELDHSVREQLISLRNFVQTFLGVLNNLINAEHEHEN